MGFLPSGNVTRSQLSIFLKDSIYSSMAFFQSSLSIKSIAYLTILGSFCMEGNEKVEKN